MTRTVVGFYGDDFTGSSENLAQFYRRGLRSRLFFAPIPAEAVDEVGRQFDVVGFAGTTRAMPAEAIGGELRPFLHSLARLSPRLLQYKICSTFDSSPAIGSFGEAMAAARSVFPECAIAILPAVPDFGRHTVFGHHFARFGSEIVRLDRHPSMSVHPRTPMREADLALHLGQQTALPLVNITLPVIRSEAGARGPVLDAFRRREAVIFDCLDNSDLRIVSSLLWDLSQGRTLFALSAQGLPQMLGETVAGQTAPERRAPVRTEIPPVDRLLVLSGSCAQQTERQIAYVERQGWPSLHFDPTCLRDEAERDRTVAGIVDQLVRALETGRSAVVYSARGMDARLAEADAVPAAALGPAFAMIARKVRERTSLRRIVFAGGDSSSYAVRSLGADALDIEVFDEAQSCHLCRLVGGGEAVDGLEVMLKGGQVGGDRYFVHATTGGPGR